MNTPTIKHILIVGGVAAGATAAARMRRLDEHAEITILERGPYVSFANCGLPYFISGDIKRRSQLLLQTPEGFFSRYRVNVRTNTEAVVIERDHKTVVARTPAGEERFDYDALVLAQGGSPVVPQLPGIALEARLQALDDPGHGPDTNFSRGEEACLRGDCRRRLHRP